MMKVAQLENMANSIRCLSMDAIQKAGSGHPGLPLGCADLGALVYGEIMKHDPAHPDWINRDRFVLSAGHGSMLLYSLLHITGYNIPLEDIKNFRQFGSLTPGHPEYGFTPGVETTTGPLGAGISNAVGMAIAETHLAARFNSENEKIIDHFTYVLAGDGCFMEGVASEAASLAGHLKLGKLIVFYDSNRITIEGSTDLAFTEDVLKRFEAYGWQTLTGNAYDYQLINSLVETAREDTQRPTLIKLDSVIGYGAPNKAGTHSVHGTPLGSDEIKAARKHMGTPDEDFYINPEVKDFIREKQGGWAGVYDEWKVLFSRWEENNPDKKELWKTYFSPLDTESLEMPVFETGTALATRKASGAVLQSIAAGVPNFTGGSADLSPSNNTYLEKKGDYSPLDRLGRNFHFGVREHGMGGIVNGMMVHGGLRTYCATFLVFSDYMRPAIRLASLMEIPQIFVFTHDSIFVGEDGPTHQPIEHVESLRLIPNLLVLRPGDPEETCEAWRLALSQKDRPCVILLTRQNLPVFTKPASWKEDIKKGSYIAYDCESEPETVIITTGSEVSLSIEAAKQSGKKVRVLSVLSRELFLEMDKEERKTLIPEKAKVVATEAGVTSGWKGLADQVLGIDRFGISAPADIVADKLGFTLEKLIQML